MSDLVIKDKTASLSVNLRADAGEWGEGLERVFSCIGEGLENDRYRKSPVIFGI